MILDWLSGSPTCHSVPCRAPLPSTLAVMPSVLDFQPSEFFPFDSVGQKKYYNRPKFLQAPDPDTLATPTFGVVGEAGRIPSWSLLELLNRPDTFEGLTPPDYFYSTWQDDFPASIPRKHTLSDSPFRFTNASIFPLPPTLEDIQRMEPDLSPESMMKRVGTIGPGDRPNDVRSNATLYPSARTKSSVSDSMVGGYSPIARPMKRCRTSSVGQGLFTQDFIDGIEREVRFTHKRLRVEADGFIWHARWYTDYLINALTRTQFRGKPTPAPVYDRLWRNITDFLWDFRFSESVILLAFWYIDRLFPNGFMHPGMFTTSEGGAIAWRIFLLGNMLAEKWLEDTTHLLSIWQPFFELPIKTVKALERTVLRILDHNIYISNHEWQTWITHLRTYCQTEFLAGHSNDLQCTAMAMLHELMADASASLPEPDRPRALYTHEVNSCELVLRLLEPCYSADRFEFTSVPLLLRTRSYLAAWNPAADPIVMKRPRAFGIAPIARPTHRAVRHPTHVPLVASRPMLGNPISNVFAEPDIDEHYYLPIMT